MTLKEQVLNLMQTGEKFIEVSPFCYMRLMPDGSAIIYKSMQEMVLSRHDLEFLKHLALPVPMFTPGPESEKDVHTEHCCVIHGCKYGKDDCPVMNDVKRQSHACESCYMDADDSWGGWREAPEAKPYVIIKVIETCDACPSQWSARTDDGRYVYIRYRHGNFRVDVDDDNKMEEYFISELGGDGVLSFEEMQRRTEGLLDFSMAKWVATSEEI